MVVKTFNITDDPDVTLTAYISDISGEMKNMQVKPAVLVFPGGAYKYCSDREAEPVALAYLAKGFNAFVLRYSLNEKSKFPTPLNDAVAAIEFIRNNSKEFHTDPQRLAVCGFSAGGHLAAAVSTMTDVRPNACVLGYPCILSSTSPILANPVESVNEYVTKQTPPTFIFAASNDGCVPIENSLSYAQALSKNSVSFEMHIFAEGDHGFSLGTDVVCENKAFLNVVRPNSYWLDRSAEWLKKMM